VFLLYHIPTSVAVINTNTTIFVTETQHSVLLSNVVWLKHLLILV